MEGSCKGIYVWRNIVSEDSAQLLRAYLEERLGTYREELRQLCAIECPTSSKPGVDVAAAWVWRWAEARGWATQTYSDSLVGESIVTRIHGSGKLRVMLVAHLDTVYPIGVAAERPLREQDGKLVGPGSCDNKSGLLSGLYAMAALQDLGLLTSIGEVTMVCGSDEETDMRVSLELLRELAPTHDLALVLEAGRENGDIVAARKGGGLFVLETHGRAAHAGVEPEKGAHAILGMAHNIVALQALNGMRPGVTVNVGVLHGGSVPNAVPDYACAEIDARVVDPADVATVTAAIQAIAAQQTVRDVTATLSGGFRVGPMAKTAEIAALADLAGRCAEELGFSVNAAATGGISYANLLAELGLPVLDGLGPVGGLDHSPQEYIDPASIVPRTALLALIMLRASEQ
jgi:glutamate carboxypeptidase